MGLLVAKALVGDALGPGEFGRSADPLLMIGGRGMGFRGEVVWKRWARLYLNPVLLESLSSVS